MVKLKAFTPPIVDKKGKLIKNSISSLEEIELNGFQQSVLIRGYNINNPILLYLHGGPGCSEIGLFRHFNSELEKHFVVVNWDQRGCCKSYHSLDILEKTLNTKHIISDIKELVLILRKRFGKKKVYLMGHSWGSIIGTLFTKKYPRLVETYIGVSQVANMVEAENIAYSFILNKAITTNNKEAIKDLNDVKWVVPYVGDEYLEKVRIEGRWVHYFGGSLFGEKNLLKLIKVLFRASEYDLIDVKNYIKGSEISLKKLWKEMLEVNFIKQVPKLKVPVVFIQGKHDYQTPLMLTKYYYQILKAPNKRLIVFDRSAHNPNYEENKKFNNLIISIKNSK